MLIRAMPEPSTTEGRRIQGELKNLLEGAAARWAESTASRRQGYPSEPHAATSRFMREASVYTGRTRNTAPAAPGHLGNESCSAAVGSMRGFIPHQRRCNPSRPRPISPWKEAHGPLRVDPDPATTRIHSARCRNPWRAGNTRGCTGFLLRAASSAPTAPQSKPTPCPHPLPAGKQPLPAPPRWYVRWAPCDAMPSPPPRTQCTPRIVLDAAHLTPDARRPRRCSPCPRCLQHPRILSDAHPTLDA
jgi:hypothetical protein